RRRHRASDADPMDRVNRQFLQSTARRWIAEHGRSGITQFAGGVPMSTSPYERRLCWLVLLCLTLPPDHPDVAETMKTFLLGLARETRTVVNSPFVRSRVPAPPGPSLVPSRARRGGGGASGMSDWSRPDASFPASRLRFSLSFSASGG